MSSVLPRRVLIRSMMSCLDRVENGTRGDPGGKESCNWSCSDLVAIWCLVMRDKTTLLEWWYSSRTIVSSSRTWESELMEMAFP